MFLLVIRKVQADISLLQTDLINIFGKAFALFIMFSVFIIPQGHIFSLSSSFTSLGFTKYSYYIISASRQSACFTPIQ